ncbi:DUF2515 domain-containing protein [Bacillus marinisedimentorum]|uniref:DUF2515 domain-containing protein n=1 Tax=Bacillus marinisedimentorum TaxID=1821260 RepID=UPI001FDFE6E0|nr:DUF2515 domain-containing protein [Bacillus marinisedimentorum]
MTADNKEIIQIVKKMTDRKNIDNITRTKAYERYYSRNPEIRWALLAGMVSRNAGYNMTDLESKWFQRSLKPDRREQLFLTYERANWLIFSDAFPQLLLYRISKDLGKPMFGLLNQFNVSVFMEREWNRFWVSGDIERLVYALIINEQHVIQKPVIEHPVYEKAVFRSLAFKFEERLHFSTVLFPTREGELFGYSVHGFKKVSNRIKLGKRLAGLLFHPGYYRAIIDFSNNTEHTGSRNDYGRFLGRSGRMFSTPMLRLCQPVVEHSRNPLPDWYKGRMQKWWFRKEQQAKNIRLTSWYIDKQRQLHTLIRLEEKILPKGKLF